MSTLTIRLPLELIDRLRQKSRRTGLPVGRVVRQNVENGLAQEYPRHTVVTVDEDDFRVYRRNKREAIPLLCPPKKK
jgi:hypothetical protein